VMLERRGIQEPAGEFEPLFIKSEQRLQGIGPRPETVQSQHVVLQQDAISFPEWYSRSTWPGDLVLAAAAG
jgi:hypothetical protein